MRIHVAAVLLLAASVAPPCTCRGADDAGVVVEPPPPPKTDGCPGGGTACEGNASSATASSDDGEAAGSDGKVGGAAAMCSLYLAPSSIPDAGLGLYTAVDLPPGRPVGGPNLNSASSADPLSDLMVPILDHFKALPYRGQQRFPSWLGYVWPEEPDAFYNREHEIPERRSNAFNRIDEGLNAARGVDFWAWEGGWDGDGKEEEDGNKAEDKKKTRVSAFAPGVASYLNSHPHLANVRKDDSSDGKDAAGLKLGSHRVDEGAAAAEGDGGNTCSLPDAGVGAFTPYHSITFASTRPIPAGSELFLDYGPKWHRRYDLKYRHPETWASLDERERKLIPKFLPTEAEKRGEGDGKGNCKEAKKCIKKKGCFGRDGNGSEYHLPWELKCYRECNDICNKKYKEQNEKENDGKDGGDDENKEQQQIDPVKDAGWLQTNGMCVDNIRPGPSSIPQAGRGAFAARSIPADSVIAPAPLLVLRRDDLNIYRSDETQEAFRDVLNLDELVGRELLLNYAYGHEDSEVLLVPIGPGVNFINHASGDDRSANAAIRWPATAGDANAEGKGGRLGLFDPKDWLSLHPIDVLDMSGRVMMEFVALRDIEAGEEILIDYGRKWEEAWAEHVDRHGREASAAASCGAEEGGAGKDKERGGQTQVDGGAFRHEIGVPPIFYPPLWLNQSVTYELDRSVPLKVGEPQQMKWAHNKQPICENLYRIALPPGFSSKMRAYLDRMGLTDRYESLLFHEKLKSNDWYTFAGEGTDGIDEDTTWFAQRYFAKWNFDMHYVAAWDEPARLSFLRALGDAGFDAALDGIGTHFGFDNLTCFHASFMGVSEADNSRTHTDIFTTNGKGFNLVWPAILVNGSKPELDVQADDSNIILGVNYEEDVAYVMGDWIYHKTRAIEYDEKGMMRVVGGTYCAQIDDSNHDMMALIYDGEDPAPFADQFDGPFKEIHWGRASLPK